MDRRGLPFLAVCLLCLVCSWAEEPDLPTHPQPNDDDVNSLQRLDSDDEAEGTDDADMNINDADGDDANGYGDGDDGGVAYQVLSSEPTPAPAVTPATIAPDLPDFYIRGDGGAVCLRAAFHAEITVKYTTKGSETNVLQARMNVPTNAKHSGQCANSTSTLQIAWADNSLALTFSEQKSNKTRTGEERSSVLVWAVTSITFSFNTSDTSIFPEALNPGIHQVTTTQKERHFEAPSNFSYSCSTQEDILLAEYSNGTQDTSVIPMVTMAMWDVAVEAFRMNPSGDFSHAARCAPDVEKSLPSQNIAPVVVAAVLAGIILVIIVAYFFIKNRYQSPYKGLE